MDVYVCMYVCLYVCIYLSMALQPFVRPWPLFQFLDLLHCRWNSLDGGSGRHKAATCTQDSTNVEQTQTDIHASSAIQTHDPSV
jgi:hypothetical protein